MMKFLINRISFCWQGFKHLFYQMGQFFQVWPIKQILALFLFSASAHYRANWINNAAIIVWVSWYVCQSVVCMSVIKKY